MPILPQEQELFETGEAVVPQTATLPVDLGDLFGGLPGIYCNHLRIFELINLSRLLVRF